MDYIDWVEQVMVGIMGAWQAADENQKNILGIDFEDVGEALGFTADEVRISGEGTPVEAILDALRDLDELGLVEQQRHKRYFRLTQLGRQVAQLGLTALWDSMLNIYLEPEQLQVLEKLAVLCQEDHGSYVCLREHLVDSVGAQMDKSWGGNDPANRVYFIVQQLDRAGLAKLRGAMGAISGFPTYRGLVVATRKMPTEWQRTISELLPDWETTNVDFKQELNLKTPTNKAEFVKDILALVNTKSSGRRFMVIGFSDDTHDFLKSVDSSITQDRIEDILNAYAEPFPTVRYNTAPWSGGTVGVIEVVRESSKLPYRIKAGMIGKIQAGDVFVRHGSHTTKLHSGDRELDDLVAEGERARQ